MLQKIGLCFMLIGTLLLCGWGLKGFFADSLIPLPLRLGVGAIGAGIIIILAALIWGRLTKAKEEKGEEKPRW